METVKEFPYDLLGQTVYVHYVPGLVYSEVKRGAVTQILGFSTSPTNGKYRYYIKASDVTDKQDYGWTVTDQEDELIQQNVVWHEKPDANLKLQFLSRSGFSFFPKGKL